MTFGPKKLLNMAGIFAIMIFGCIMTYTGDTLERTRLELEDFFAAELSNCEITEVVERQYSGRGTYGLFRTNCSSTYYPILLDYKEDYENYDRFEESMTVNKKANSVDLKLTGSTSVLELKIRHPSDEDDRFDSMKFVLIFFGTALVIMVFIPNSFWERKRN
jgi:hypothetical protein